MGDHQAAFGQFALDQERRDQGDAHLVHGRLGEHGEQLVTRPAHVAWHVQAARVEPLAPGVGAGALLQQRQVGDLFGAELALAVEQGRAAHRQEVFLHQEVGLGAGPVGVAEIDGGVQLGVGKQKRPGAVGQVDGDVRVQALEFF